MDRNITALRRLLASEATEDQASATTFTELLIEMDKKPEAIHHPKEIRRGHPEPHLWFRPVLQIIGTASAGAIPVYHAFQWVDFSLLLPRKLHDLLFAVKFTEKDQESDACRDLQRRVEISNRIPNHPNILRPLHSFTCDEGNFCVAMPSMILGSIRSIITSSDFPNGLHEDFIVIALRAALKGLSLIHCSGLVHGEISSGHIFLNDDYEIKLAFAATLYDHGNDPNPTDSTFIWAAPPEIYYGNNVQYTSKGDIWMIGITALEMACGKFKSTSREDLESFLQRVRNEKIVGRNKKRKERSSSKRTAMKQYINRICDRMYDRMSAGVSGSVRFSEAFENIVKRCLEEDPGKRPTAAQLLLEPLGVRSSEYI